MKTQTKNLGIVSFGKRVLVTDPCYDRGTWCAGVIENVLPGEYATKIKVQDHGEWGNRVAKLSVKRMGSTVVRKEDSGIDVGVDSGQAGIFDDSIYPHDDVRDYDDENSFYRKVCRLTYDEGSQAFGGGIYEGMGVVSSSGYGDGSYACILGYDADNNVVAIDIVYL